MSTSENAKTVDGIAAQAETPAEQTGLPERVTEKPRDEEHMHLGQIKGSPKAVRVYLNVSDDHGEMLGSKVLEEKVKGFCRKHANLDPEKVKHLDKVLQEALELAKEYVPKINMAENSLGGTVTKYRIRQGMLFKIMKTLVKSGKLNWIDWFKNNFDPREFRSTQDYMKLAKVKNIIRYAWLGKERLMQSVRQLTEDDKKADDPLGNFFARSGLDFHAEEDLDPVELKIQTDVAINYQKLVDKGLDDVPREKVDALVRNNLEITNRIIEVLEVAKAKGEDLGACMDRILSADGKPEPTMTPEKKAAGFKKTVDRFLTELENALADEAYRSSIDPDKVRQIREKLQSFERLFATA